tara:strand:+ start:1398 stop:1997 length:600 start_codon:yes stop_codon:yes gene_type:complete
MPLTRDELNQSLEEVKQDIMNSRDEQFRNLEEKLSTKIKNLEQVINRYDFEDDIDFVQPFERDMSMAPDRPQLSSAAIKENNKHITHLSNHELHQINSMIEKDHKRPIKTILDEPMGDVLDKTIHFLTYSIDSFHQKIHEAELMEDIHGDDTGVWITLKKYLMAMILFFREDRNIIYIGFIMIFLSIIIYFTNIITTAG